MISDWWILIHFECFCVSVFHCLLLAAAKNIIVSYNKAGFLISELMFYWKAQQFNWLSQTLLSPVVSESPIIINKRCMVKGWWGETGLYCLPFLSLLLITPRPPFSHASFFSFPTRGNQKRWLWRWVRLGYQSILLTSTVWQMHSHSRLGSW